MKIAKKHLPHIQATVAAIRYDGQLSGKTVHAYGSFPGYGQAGAKFCLALGGADVTSYSYGSPLRVSSKPTGNNNISLEDALWVASFPCEADGSRPQLDDVMARARRWSVSGS